MSDSDISPRSGFRDWLSFHADAFGVVGGVVLVLTIIPTIAKWLPWPWFLIPLTIGATLFCVWVFARVFLINGEPLQTIGYSTSDPSPTVGEAATTRPLEHIQPAALDVDLDSYELTKLVPNVTSTTVDPEDVPAHNDDHGIIVAGSAGEKTFRCFVVPFTNAKQRGRVASAKKVRGRIYLRGFAGWERTIHRGAWLSEKETEIDLVPNCPPRRFILITVEGARVYSISRDFDSAYKGAVITREELVEDSYEMTLTLAGADQQAPIKQCKYILEIARTPTLAVKVSHAYFWLSDHLYSFGRTGYDFLEKLNVIYMNAFKTATDYYVAHDKPMTDFGVHVREVEMQQQGEIVDEIRAWETEAASFIERHFGLEEKKKFVEGKPSIDAGFEQRRKTGFERLSTIKVGDPGTETVNSLPDWALRDSVFVRLMKIKELREGLRP